MDLLASISFAVSCAGVFYTVAGYPLLLGWLAKRLARPVHKAYAPRSVSVIIAVHNGQPWLADKLHSVLELEYPRELMEILVVSDGSTDGTDAVAGGFAAQGVRLIRVPRGGKPAALNAGIAQARGEILLLTDARQTLAPESLRNLVSCFADPAVGVASGDLLIRQRGNYEEQSVGLYWRYERWIRKQLSSLDSMFGASGALYAIRAGLARSMPPDTLLDDMYLPLGAFFEGYRLIVEENARAFDYPTDVNIEFRRKVRTLAGNYQILWRFPALLTFRNRMLWHFLSYKLARLLLPWMMLLLFVSSLWLPWPWLAVPVVGGQLVFYALAALDPWIRPSALKRLSTPARAVVSMLAAAVCAVTIFVLPPERFWKPTQVRGAKRSQANSPL
ncbi:MAG: hypothetical protein PGMFKBFP_03045 [Anaerolineales bacterium]|nr:hypothetical protein [Anaerolineales bacterium]